MLTFFVSSSFTDATVTDLLKTPTVQVDPAVSEPVEEADPFLNFTDDDVRQGLETLLGYVPRKSNPGVRQLGFRGFFKQKVKEMHAEELFSTSVKAPVGGKARARARSPAGVSKVTLQKTAPATDLPRLQSPPKKKARFAGSAGSKDRDEAEKGVARNHRGITPGAELLLECAEETLTSAKESGKSGVVEIPGVEKREEGSVPALENGRPLSNKGKTGELTADGEPKDYLGGLLGRWNEVSSLTALQAFEKLNGWTPEERSMLRNSGSVKAWCRAKFGEMLERKAVYVRFRRAKSVRHAYQWEPWKEELEQEPCSEADEKGEKEMEKSSVQEREGGSDLEETGAGTDVRKRKAEEGGAGTGACKRICEAEKQGAPGESKVAEEDPVDVPGEPLRKYRLSVDGIVSGNRKEQAEAVERAAKPAAEKKGEAVGGAKEAAASEGIASGAENDLAATLA